MDPRKPLQDALYKIVDKIIEEDRYSVTTRYHEHLILMIKHAVTEGYHFAWDEIESYRKAMNEIKGDSNVKTTSPT